MLQDDVANAHSRLRVAVDRLDDPEAPMPGYSDWSKKDLIAHLTSIESRIREQVQCAIDDVPWTPEDVDTFNARQVSARRQWTMDQLQRELADESASTERLLASLTETHLTRPFDHPRRGRITVADLLAIIPRHITTHLADLEASV
jgi:DinB superfamily